MKITDFQIKVSCFIDDINEGMGWIDDDRIEIEQQFNNYSGQRLSDDHFEILYHALKDYNLLYKCDEAMQQYRKLFLEGKTDDDCEEMESIHNKLSGLFNTSDFESGFNWLIEE